MPRESCISHPPDVALVIVRQDYVGICSEAPDPNCAAAILNNMEYWTNVKIGSSQQARIENEIAAREGLPATQDDSLWVWKSNEEMQAELLHLFGRNKIIDNLDWLVKASYLETRANPKYQWDRTKQYRMTVQTVQDAVWKWYTSLNDASFKIKRSTVEKQTINPPKNKRTIPETTTQDTTETDSRGDAPHGADSSEKPATKPVKPVKPRKPDPLFDAVAKHIFGISDTAGLSAAGSTVGAIKSVVKRLCEARAPQWSVEEQCDAVAGYVKQCSKANPVQKWKAGFEPAFLKYIEAKLAQPQQHTMPPAAAEMKVRDDSFNIQRAIAAVKMFHASDKPSQRELLETNTRFLTERGYQVLEGGVVIAPELSPQTA